MHQGSIYERSFMLHDPLTTHSNILKPSSPPPNSPPSSSAPPPSHPSSPSTRPFSAHTSSTHPGLSPSSPSTTHPRPLHIAFTVDSLCDLLLAYRQARDRVAVVRWITDSRRVCIIGIWMGMRLRRVRRRRRYGERGVC